MTGRRDDALHGVLESKSLSFFIKQKRISHVDNTTHYNEKHTTCTNNVYHYIGYVDEHYIQDHGE